MKRIVVSGLGVFLIAVVVGVMGCDGGGVEPGIPADTKPGVPLEDMNKMANMGTSPKGPPAAGAPTPAPATPEK